MSEAENLLDQLADGDAAVMMANPETEPHIVIGTDRFITVPAELKRIGVQYDHNIETVIFDCPRYWDGRDLSAMYVYVNYMRSDGGVGKYLAEDVTVDDTDDSVMHFSWTLSGDTTKTKGVLSFLVCAKSVDGDGNEVNHWNSELNRSMTISEGLEVQEAIINQYPDIITNLLVRMSAVEVYYEDFKRISAETKQYVDDAIAGSDVDLTDYVTKDYVSNIQADLESSISEVQTGLTQRVTYDEFSGITNSMGNHITEIENSLSGSLEITNDNLTNLIASGTTDPEQADIDSRAVLYVQYEER